METRCRFFNLSPFVSGYQKKSKLTLVDKKGHDIVFLLIRRSLRKTTKKNLIFCYQFYYEEKFTGPHNQNFWRGRLTSLILSSRNLNPPSTEPECPTFLATNLRKVRDKKPHNPTRQRLDIRRCRLMLCHPYIPILGTRQVK